MFRQMRSVAFYDVFCLSAQIVVGEYAVLVRLGEGLLPASPGITPGRGQNNALQTYITHILAHDDSRRWE